MSGGFNHHSGCTCPWCEHQSFTISLAIGFTAKNYDSFTVPNARCPKCDARVFFYSSPDGGKVYFDDLGPPWPKHPCMDQTSTRAFTVRETTAREHPAWIREGWEPVRFQNKSIKKGKEPVLAAIQELRTGFVKTAFFPSLPTDIDFLPCLMKRSPPDVITIQTPNGTHVGRELVLKPDPAWRERFKRLGKSVPSGRS